MKRIKLKVLVFTSFLLSIIFIACNKDTDNIDLYSNPNQKTFLSKKMIGEKFNNLSGYYQNNELFLEGDFKLTKLNENQLVVYTETNSTKHIFLLDGIKQDLIDNKFEINRLYYLKNGILLNNSVFLGIDANINKLLKKDIIKLSKNNTLIENNTSKIILHKWISKNDSNYENLSIDELIETTRNQVNLTHAGDCDSGGEGANSCSTQSSSGTGCSVSCGSGYYACCNQTAIGPDDCHCNKK